MPAFGPCRRACGCAGLFFCRRTPLSCLSSPHRSLPRLSFRLPSFFPSSVFLPVFRFSLAGPHFPLPAFPTARVSLCPCFSQPAAPQLCRFVLSRLYSVWFFFCHFLFFRSSSIACRLLSIARCAVHRSSPVVCCPSPIVYPLLPVARNLPPAVHRPPLVGGCPYPVPRTPYPAAPLSAAVRSGSRLLYPRNPGLRVCGSCLPCRSAAGSVGRSFRKNASALRTLVAAPFLTK